MKKSKLGTETIQDILPNKVENPEKTIQHAKKLEAANTGLNDALNQALKALEEKDNEIKKLYEMLASNVPMITSSGKLETISVEEEIAELQLRRLQDKARVGELNLDEVKRYDLLVKNKRLSKDQATDIPGKPKLPANKKDLLKIAETKKTEEKENE